MLFGKTHKGGRWLETPSQRRCFPGKPSVHGAEKRGPTHGVHDVFVNPDCLGRRVGAGTSVSHPQAQTMVFGGVQALESQVPTNNKCSGWTLGPWRGQPGTPGEGGAGVQDGPGLLSGQEGQEALERPALPSQKGGRTPPGKSSPLPRDHSQILLLETAAAP